MHTLGKDHKFEQRQPCLNCKEPLAGSFSIDPEGEDTAPTEGDVSICASCGHIMGFTKEGKIRELTNEEIIKVAGDKRLLLASYLLAKSKAKGKR